MLSALRIQNLALVDDLTWELGRGLVGVTGETGAGKSIIVGAIKLVLGDRADRSLIRSGAEGCSVEAVFQLSDAEPVNAKLTAAGFEPCEDGQLVIKRVIGAHGANKQFVNCSPATLNVLKALSHYLVDLHGPHEHQSLISQDRQLDMLDAFAQADEARRAYVDDWRHWKRVTQELEALSTSERANEQEIDLLRYQIDEIDRADPKPAEVEPLEQRYRVASNASHLLDVSRRILANLEEAEPSVLSLLSETVKLVRELEGTDANTTEFTREFDSAQVELEEMAGSLRDYIEALEIDPAEIRDLEERINVLESLKRKYGNSIEEILAFRDRAQTKLARIEGRGDAIAKLEAARTVARRRMDEAGMLLSQRRRAAAPKLAKRIVGHLRDLGFQRAKIDIEMVAGKHPAAHGMETIDFIFAPNPGEPSKPLRLIASSGEMSRVMLAVKSALAKQDAIPLLVFDEIDANVGGEIASAVGVKMAELSASHQVIAITHLPQVAALARHHYVVEKEFAGERTRSRLEAIAGSRRVAELARMLGGDRDSAEAHARNLLAAAGVPSA